ncbi:hypothetical protein [Bdellovibrio sp. HCB337]|uniref:hypothetical protein n=1 Tax=Bdellovibrio sp. HCB337 TaxID=3394358 RepID=UPI0039A5FB98
MLKNSILVISTGLILAACSASVKTEEVAPPGNNEKANGGPYTVDFSAADSTYKHSFKIPINQAEGKVEYFIKTAEAADIEFVSTQMKVTGCPANQVTHKTFWIPDSQNTVGQYVVPGSTLKTRAGVQGTFMHIVLGLTNCTDVELNTVLKKKKVSNMKCKESSDSTCRVQVYCREGNYPTNYVEVEVWQDAWGMSLRKFMNGGDGTRGLMASNSVTVLNNGTDTIYTNNSGSDKVFLKYNNQTFAGLYSQDIMGNTFDSRVTCTLP